MRYYSFLYRCSFPSILLWGVLLFSFSSCKKDNDTFDFGAQRVREDSIIREYLMDNGVYGVSTRTESGLYYYPLTESTLPKVPEDTLIEVHYAGMILYGDTFDASRPRGSSLRLQSKTTYFFDSFAYTELDSSRVIYDIVYDTVYSSTDTVYKRWTKYFPLDSVADFYGDASGETPQTAIVGWQEGLLLMREGQTMRFFVPSHLGYGGQTKGYIPPLSILVFDVEMLKVGY